MKTKRLTLISFLLYSISTLSQTENIKELPSDFIAYCSNINEPIDKPIEMDWVQTDIDVIKNKINILPKYALTLTKLIEIIPDFFDGKYNFRRKKTYDLGYGLKSTQHTIQGGYGSYIIDALYSDNHILKLRITINNYEEIIDKYLTKNIKLPFICLNGMPTYDIVNQNNIQNYNKKGRVFIQSYDSNEKRQNSINYFTNIYNGGVFEEPYYIRLRLGKETFNNLRYFLVNNDYAALEDLLYSPSPTSRLFVARTLIYVKENKKYKPNNDINKRIKDIISNSKLIESGIISCWSNKFKYEYFDINKDYEKLLKTE